MTRSYEETRWNTDENQRDIVARWSFTVYPGDNEHLTVCRDGKVKTVLVKEDSEFVYKLMKTRVNARGGATGLFRYVDDCLFDGFCEALAWKILNHCFYDCKGV